MEREVFLGKLKERTDSVFTELAELPAPNMLGWIPQITEQFTSVACVVDNLQETIARLCSELTNEMGEATKTFADLKQQNNEAMAETETALSGVEEFTESLSGSFVELIEDTMQECDARLGEALDAVSTTLLAPIEELKNDCSIQLRLLMSKYVEDLIPDKMKLIQEEWISEIRLQLRELLSKVEEKLEEFRRSVIDGADKSRDQRDQTKFIIDLLDRVVEPVVAEFSRVKELAESAGVSIG